MRPRDAAPVAACLRLPIVDVTEFLLRRLLDGRAEAAAPLFSFRHGRAIVRGCL